MQLSLKQIREITRGVTRVAQEEDGFHFYRFTKEQEQVYKDINLDSHMKTFATAGVKFVFRTNSETLYLKVNVSKGSSRKYFSYDIFVDGKPIGYLDNYGDRIFEPNYTAIELPQGTFEKSFDLGKGEKEVTIYFPWSVKGVVEEISLDDDAWVEGVPAEKIMIAFGDSITHGYDALRPSNRYASLLAEALHAQEINKAIGGEFFYHCLAEAKEDIEPDYVLIAYGTNDWNGRTREHFVRECRSFYKTISEKYPKANIIGLTPIWRADYNGDKREFGSFEEVSGVIQELTSDLPNVTILEGFDFVPHEAKYFSDLYLHPTDEGFRLYFESLKEKIMEVL